jgi:hypothetical protein
MPKPTAKPAAKPTPKPTPRATPDPAEQRRFSQMRRIPYFATMTDAQLRQQRLPPGLKDWGEVAGVTQQLDDIRWLFLPPETGVAGSPAPDAIATDHLIVRWLTASDALPVPSPSVGTDAEGLETTTWQSEEGSIQLARRPGTATAVVRLRPDPLGREPEERRLEVAWDPDPTRFRQLVVEALRALASPPPSASPSP